MTGKAELRRWALAGAFLLPVVALYTAHYWNSLRMPGWVATGFIHNDMPLYVANAREYLDRPGLALGYSNAYSIDPANPRIYFQPQTLLFAAVWGATGADPGLLFLLWGLLAGLLCVRVAIALYEDLCGPEARWGLPVFLWGGGVFALAEVAERWWSGTSLIPEFRRDPSAGWWFLNLGRNLVFPTEAYYHFLSLGCILLLVRRRWAAAVAVLFLLSISHPFTGVQFGLITLAWLILERYGCRNADVPAGSLVGAGACLVLHLSYYLIFLPQFPEHASVMQQFQAPWLLRADAMWLAYTPVALLAAWQWRRWFDTPARRLLVVWLVVSFGLANHEWFIEPHQPTHFTRGYIWMPLFLLGAPTLIAIFQRIATRSRALAVALVLVWVSDNLVWFWVNSRQPTGVYVRADALAVLKILQQLPQPQNDWILFTNDSYLAFLSATYSGVRSWYSHYANTPYAHERYQERQAFFQHGRRPAILPRGRTVIVEAGPEDRPPAASPLARISPQMQQTGQYLIVFY